MEPTQAQLKSLYRQCYFITNTIKQPVHIVRIDERTKNIFILAGPEESLQLQIKPDGELI
ncbi:MAG: DUF6888 family protein [Chroococcidiopsis sp.]